MGAFSVSFKPVQNVVEPLDVTVLGVVFTFTLVPAELSLQPKAVIPIARNIPVEVAV